MPIATIISGNDEIKKLYDELCSLELAGKKDSEEYKAIGRKIKNINNYLEEECKAVCEEPEGAWLELDSIVRKINYNRFQTDFPRVLSSDTIPSLDRTFSTLAKRTQYSTEYFDEITADLGTETVDVVDSVEFLTICSDDEYDSYSKDYLYSADVISQWIRFYDNKIIKIFLDSLEEKITQESNAELRDKLIKFKYDFIYQNVDSEYYILGENAQAQYVNTELIFGGRQEDTYEIAIKINFATIVELINFIVRSMNSVDKELHRIILADLYITAILENADGKNWYINEKLTKLTDIYVKRFSKYFDENKVNLLFLQKLKSRKLPKRKNFVSKLFKPKNV